MTTYDLFLYYSSPDQRQIHWHWDYSHPDDQTTQTNETPGFKPLATENKVMNPN